MKINTKITGAYYLGKVAQGIVSSLERGMELELVRDPNNEFDKNAVKLMFNEGCGSIHIGYVSKDDNEQVAEALDKGEEIIATALGEKGKITIQCASDIPETEFISEEVPQDDGIFFITDPAYNTEPYYNGFDTNY